MTTARNTLVGLIILGASLLICLAGIIYLASSGKPIPDVLIATTGLIAGAIAGLLNPSRSSEPVEVVAIEGEHRGPGGYND